MVPELSLLARICEDLLSLRKLNEVTAPVLWKNRIRTLSKRKLHIKISPSESPIPTTSTMPLCSIEVISLPETHLKRYIRFFDLIFHSSRLPFVEPTKSLFKYVWGCSTQDGVNLEDTLPRPASSVALSSSIVVSYVVSEPSRRVSDQTIISLSLQHEIR